MLVLITAGKYQRLKSSPMLFKILGSLLFLLYFFCTTAQAQVFDTFEAYTTNGLHPESPKMLERYKQNYALATIDNVGNLKDQEPDYISKILFVAPEQQAQILKYTPKLSAVELLVIQKATDISQLPIILFESLPALKYLIIEVKADVNSITEKQLRDKFQGQDLEDKVILLKPLGKDK